MSAAETVAAAERDAEQLRQNAADGLENARKDALATMDTARAEADKTLLAAQARAEAAVESSQARISELEAARMERTKQFDGVVEELRAVCNELGGRVAIRRGPPGGDGGALRVPSSPPSVR